MASWLMHLRIAEQLLPVLSPADPDLFYIGSIAPDCGLPADGGGYDPGMDVTHFTAGPRSDKSDCDYDRLWRQYLTGETDPARRSFYLGYYAHLLTDCRYVFAICRPTIQAHGRANLPAAKREWLTADFVWLRDHRSPALERFCTLPPFQGDFPPWYRRNEIGLQMPNVAAWYAGPWPIPARFRYVQPEQVEAFLPLAVAAVTADFKTR